jgi:hypothetical protein
VLEAVVLIVLLLVGVNFLSSRSTPDASAPAPVAAVATEAAEPPPPPAEEPAVEAEPTSSFASLQSVGGVLRTQNGAAFND